MSDSQSVSLVLLSGGIDSTFALFDLLKNSDDIVLAHHVNLINREGRHKAETQACARIVEYLQKKYRPFFYTESSVDRSRFKAPGFDVFTAAFEGGIAASNFLLDTGVMPQRWVLGINEEEIADLENRGPSRVPYLQATMSASCWPNKPPKYKRPRVMTKAQLIEEMGPELTALCWTCRRPLPLSNNEFGECGECKTCLLMNEIRLVGQQLDVVTSAFGKMR